MKQRDIYFVCNDPINDAASCANRALETIFRSRTDGAMHFSAMQNAKYKIINKICARTRDRWANFVSRPLLNKRGLTSDSARSVTLLTFTKSVLTVSRSIFIFLCILLLYFITNIFCYL